ncbi:glycosyltransferase [Flammeovirga aprica]|uniref:Glycosyltransferase n=1 Tax=Flammeovirga aprica JL-4 TaxID=694437 RepID=A0A7X9RWW0_9BACT|nr:glycosyltransferase [Flammeovirga aprica]NME70193.1 glycosyltransferase [Flammeovirga aprica JL-4]
MPPLLSIIIINHDTLEITLKCLKHVEEALSNVTFQAEILLIDNSEDSCDKKEFLSRFPQIIYHKIQNEGFGRANNYGAKQAKGKYLVFINSDLFITSNLLETHINSLESEKVDVVSVVQIDDQKEELQFPYYFFHQTDHIKDYLLQSPFAYKLMGERKLKNITAISGAYFMMKRSLFDEVKGFDPDFFLYGEDIEFFTHRLKGKIFYIDTENKVLHYTNSSSKNEQTSFSQMHLSDALKWYKYGYRKYILYVLSTYLFYFPQWLVLSLLPISDKKYNKLLIKTYWNLLPHLIFKIPKYSNNYGSRPKPLKFK